MCSRQPHLTLRSREACSKLQASNWTPGFTEWHMLNLAYIKRESSGPVVKAVHPSPCSFLTFSIWELTSSLEDDIPGGIPAGSGGSGAHICFLKEDRQPLLPPALQNNSCSGTCRWRVLIAGIDNIVEKLSFAKDCGCPLLRSAKFLEDAAFCPPSDN